MNGTEWVKLSLEALVLAGGVGIILGYLKKLGAKFDAMAELVTGVRLDLKERVTWEALDRELSPLKKTVAEHGTRLSVVETRCDDNHR